MKRIAFFLLSIPLIIATSSCKKNNDNNDLPPQEVVTNDTSGYTGTLTVNTYYLDGNNNQVVANGTNVFLYASYNDIITDQTNSSNDLAIYRLTTASDNNVAYFGYINYGNYYVWAFNTIGGYDYERISIVQVRPQREEFLNITMLQK